MRKNMEIDVINNLISYGPAGILFGVSLVLLILASKNYKKNGNNSAKTHNPPCMELLQCKQELNHKVDNLDNKIDRLDDKVDILINIANKASI